MSGEGDEVARGIPGEEDLGTWSLRFLLVFYLFFVFSLFVCLFSYSLLFLFFS